MPLTSVISHTIARSVSYPRESLGKGDERVEVGRSTAGILCRPLTESYSHFMLVVTITVIIILRAYYINIAPNNPQKYTPNNYQSDTPVERWPI